MLAGLESDATLDVDAAETIDDLKDKPGSVILLVHGTTKEDMQWLDQQLQSIALDASAAPCVLMLDQAGDLIGREGVLPVAGCLLSSVEFDALTSAIRSVAVGLRVYSPEVMADFRPRASGTAEGQSVRNQRILSSQGRWLTPRQSQVADLLMQGFSNRDIAEALGLSESTVKVHIRTLMSEFQVSNRTQIVSRLLQVNPSASH
ncbi:DNA-binding NarL/FixJ family response regulator [Stakelama sediminis]|uniref:DNA-binding NarL/FixJ family response regulator n=1 Tax=Stakelama sediminis TaxID=463200 RepID=A0A840Z2L4_9SPHN|nr:DNA-binding NarL/FixJ family response regulator [Stakelama sediminis]